MRCGGPKMRFAATELSPDEFLHALEAPRRAWKIGANADRALQMRQGFSVAAEDGQRAAASRLGRLRVERQRALVFAIAAS